MINTLLLYPSLNPHRWTDGQRNDTRFAWAGGTCPRFAWAGGTFFPVVLLCQFWFWREIGFGCTYYYVLGVPYSCGVVLVFLVLAGNSFWCYVRTQYTIQLCDCVSFFAVAGKFYYDRKIKKFKSSLNLYQFNLNYN